MKSVPAQGWYPDLSGAHDERWFSAGQPTPLVRDGTVVSREDLPPDQQPGRPGPVRMAAREKVSAESFYWLYWTIVLPCLAAFAAAGLILAWSFVSQPTSGFELARTAVAWVQADRVVQLAASVAGAALLIALWPRPRWRRAAALAAWGIVALQIGSFLLAWSEYPGDSCTAQPGWAAITLSDSAPSPVVAAAPGAFVVVTVPGWWTGRASDVAADPGGILREDCTVSLPGGGRRAIFTTLKPGTASLSSGPPVTPFATPAWLGEVTVREARAS